MQYLDTNLIFLQEKIKDIRIAIFKSEMNSELQLPNNIIHVLEADSEGNILFFTSCTGKYSQHLEKSFYAYLDFYKKGSGFRLRASGKAKLIEDEGHAFLTKSNYSQSTAGRLVLVKMKIMQAEYFEVKNNEQENWKNKLIGAFNNFFFTEPHRLYEFN
ncbi:MAG: hypothetical protein IPL97_02605 [Niastella sp.]|mgnify:CR=1 FL=1|nr:hypothetical protein [Niastella sp.]